MNRAPDHRIGPGLRQIGNPVKQGRIDIVITLILYGADVDARDLDGQTPLYFACELGKEDVAQLLIEHKADVNAPDGDGRTPLWIACFYGYIPMATLLIANGANVNARYTCVLTVQFRWNALFSFYEQTNTRTITLDPYIAQRN